MNMRLKKPPQSFARTVKDTSNRRRHHLHRCRFCHSLRECDCDRPNRLTVPEDLGCLNCDAAMIRRAIRAQGTMGSVGCDVLHRETGIPYPRLIRAQSFMVTP